MKLELSFEQLERRRRIWRWVFLTIAFLLSFAGIVTLAVPPETIFEVALPRAFMGLALLIAGLFVALLSRLVL